MFLSKGLQILSFCFCTLFLGSVLLNEYYIRGQFPGEDADKSMSRIPKHVQRTSSPKQCDGTLCPNGCCPYKDWFCCEDGIYCADNENDCDSTYAKKTLLMKMTSKKMTPKKNLLLQMTSLTQCDGTECDGGCCFMANWICCPDGIFCAATEDDCDDVGGKENDCDLIDCGDGTCCDNPQFPQCCPGGDFCAEDDGDCDGVEKVMTTNKKAKWF